MAVPQSPTEPSAEDAMSLFKAIEQQFPSKTVGDDKWFLITMSYLPLYLFTISLGLRYSHMLAQLALAISLNG